MNHAWNGHREQLIAETLLNGRGKRARCGYGHIVFLIVTVFTQSSEDDTLRDDESYYVSIVASRSYAEGCEIDEFS